MSEKSVDQLCVNTLRILSAEAIQKARSGHPGLPMGAAATAYTLWTRFLRFNPRNPDWPDRDRFVLSAGHGSALLYSLLHLTGYDLSLDEIKNFRQWQSRTPGHPEYSLTPGVEATTGPLGQGLANAVGMAMAESILAERFNRPGHAIVDHYTYALAGDGDLMEGVAAEAVSLAGHLKLGKLIVLYDSNRITIEGKTSLTFSEDIPARFRACGWKTQVVTDGNDIEAVTAAIKAAREDIAAPSLIEVKTHIGFGSPNKQDSEKAHGEPLGDEELRLTKEKLGWPTDEEFLIPDEARNHFRRALDRGRQWQNKWQADFKVYKAEYPDEAAEFERVISGVLPDRWMAAMPAFSSDQGPLATRAVSGKILNAVAGGFSELIGGSADLAPSNKTRIADSGDYSAENRLGRNLHFGIREHAMGAISNGLALHRGLRPYCGTFLIFSDYMRPAVRMAALSKLPVIYIFTHDSLGVGEDGPTHQPVEQLMSLRAIPGLTVFRPADANETAAAWRYAVERQDGPVALILTRQKLPILDPIQYPQIPEGTSRGGYVLSDTDSSQIDLIIVATGSEVHLALEAQTRLADEGIGVRIVSIPGWPVFTAQTDEYRREVIPPDIPILAIEAGIELGWKSYVGSSVDVIGIDRFGASAPGKVVLEQYGFNLDNVCHRVHQAITDHQQRRLGIGGKNC